MRTIERSSAFKRDFKRAKAAPRHRNDLDSLVSTVVARLASDQVIVNYSAEPQAGVGSHVLPAVKALAVPNH